MSSEEKCVIITVLFFVFFMLAHHILKPSYIYNENKPKGDNNLSPLQLNLIYSLMFASSLGILCLFIEIIRNRLYIGNKENNENQSVEPPSFK